MSDLSENPFKEVSSKQDGTMFKPNIALAVNNMDCGPTSNTGYYNGIIPPTVNQYALLKSGDPPQNWEVNSDSELITLVNSLGASITTIADAKSWCSSTNNYILTSNINVTGSTNVLPFFKWDERGSYSSTSLWYNTLVPNTLGGDNKQHALSEHIAMKSTTFQYAAPYAGTIIWEIDFFGSREKVSATSEPQNGTFFTWAGVRYVSNKPVHIMKQGSQEEIIPLSYCGTQHMNYFSRYTPGEIYIAALEANTVVKIYRRNTSVSNPNYIIDEPTTTITISNQYDVYNHTFDASLDDDTWNYIWSSKPTAITYEGTSGDKGYTPLAGDVMYQQRQQYYSNMNGDESGLPGNTYCRYTPGFTSKVGSLQIGDGSGGDSLSGVPTNMLNNNYTFGDVLSDFHMVSGHSSNVIKISSYNSNDGWTLHETITITGGTLTSPTMVCRDGNRGWNLQCTNDSGGSSNFNNDQLWLWEGTETFFCSINDNSNDEEALLGWDSGEVKAVFL